MILDRQKTYEIAQALLRARTKRDGGNVAQAGTASGDGSYGEPVFGGMGFPFASQPGVTTGDETASQSRLFIPTTRPHPFRDPASFSSAGEVADMAKARGIPARDQFAFHRAPRTSPANPQAPYGRPLPPQQGYWNFLWEKLFPTNPIPTDDNPTFPPLINQLTEAEKDACYEQFDRDEGQCYNNYSYDAGALDRCRERAQTNRDLCLRGKEEMKPWNDVDEDGVRFPSPRKGRKKKK